MEKYCVLCKGRVLKKRDVDHTPGSERLDLQRRATKREDSSATAHDLMGQMMQEIRADLSAISIEMGVRHYEIYLALLPYDRKTRNTYDCGEMAEGMASFGFVIRKGHFSVFTSHVHVLAIPNRLVLVGSVLVG